MTLRRSKSNARPCYCTDESVLRLLAGESIQIRDNSPLAPGDTLWIRETWAPVASGRIPGAVRYGIAYRADNTTRWDERTTRVQYADGSRAGPLQFKGVEWRSPMHMRRAHSRLTVEVVAARAEDCIDGRDWIADVRRVPEAKS